MRLTTKRLGRNWWIVGDEEAGPYGPYPTRADAEEDRRGILRTFANMEDHSYFTGDRSNAERQ